MGSFAVVLDTKERAVITVDASPAYHDAVRRVQWQRRRDNATAALAPTRPPRRAINSRETRRESPSLPLFADEASANESDHQAQKAKGKHRVRSRPWVNPSPSPIPSPVPSNPDNTQSDTPSVEHWDIRTFTSAQAQGPPRHQRAPPSQFTASREAHQTHSLAPTNVVPPAMAALPSTHLEQIQQIYLFKIVSLVKSMKRE